MNVFEKLQKARVELQSRNIKQSGKNEFAKFTYFELGDFLPHVNVIFNELKLFSHVSFTADEATLTIVNVEKPEEKVVFASPMAEANLKGVHPIQNLGAVQTYQRRYLYMAALEISEHDTLDAAAGSEKATEKRAQPQRPKTQKTQTGTTAGSRNGAAKAKPEHDADALDKGRKAYFAEARTKIPGFLGKDAARNYAVWMASGLLERELESFTEIPLPTLRRIYAHVKASGADQIMREYDLMARERGAEVSDGPDEVPWGDDDAPIDQEAMAHA